MKYTNSNDVRLAALKNRKKHQSKQNEAIKNALCDNAPKNVTTFEDSDDEVSTTNGSKTIDILDGVEGTNDVLFDDKSIFHGKKGEKLMELQSKIGSDERFKLDSRFQSESESEESIVDEQEAQLLEERRLQSSIIDNILEKLGRNTTKPNVTNENLESFVRFDPTDSQHDQFIVSHVSDDITNESRPTDHTNNPLPDVGTETFFEVHTDFNKAISSSNQASSGFKFSFDIDESDRAETPVAKEEAFQTTVIASSVDENDTCTPDPANTDISKIKHEPFFISLNPNFKSDDCHNMVCEKTAEKIREDWIAIRNKLTNEYKKRHKDALRFQKKLSVKE